MEPGLFRALAFFYCLDSTNFLILYIVSSSCLGGEGGVGGKAIMISNPTAVKVDVSCIEVRFIFCIQCGKHLFVLQQSGSTRYQARSLIQDI